MHDRFQTRPNGWVAFSLIVSLGLFGTIAQAGPMPLPLIAGQTRGNPSALVGNTWIDTGKVCLQIWFPGDPSDGSSHAGNHLHKPATGALHDIAPNNPPGGISVAPQATASSGSPGGSSSWSAAGSATQGPTANSRSGGSFMTFLPGLSANPSVNHLPATPQVLLPSGKRAGSQSVIATAGGSLTASAPPTKRLSIAGDLDCVVDQALQHTAGRQPVPAVPTTCDNAKEEILALTETTDFSMQVVANSPDVDASYSAAVVTMTASLNSMSWAVVAADPTPVPEPASVVLLAIGLAGLALSRRQRRDSRQPS